MKLLVLAQTPPPLHGQSLMVRTLVEGLPAHGLAVHHVNLGLSRNAADIGRWRPGKIFSVLGACARAVAARFRHGCDTLYYVPAPGKRGALYRDWMVLLLCRPFFSKLVLHWQAAGLGEWLATRGPERWLTRRFLGGAELSIVLGENLRAEAAAFAPKKIAVVRNGIADPCPGFIRPPRPAGAVPRAVFLGLGVPDKGLFDAIEAIRLVRAGGGRPWELVLAGDVPDSAVARKIAALAATSGGAFRHAGFVTGVAKHELLAGASALVFPTYYAAETQGLVVAEALAYDLPVVVTDWRAVAEALPAAHVHLVPPRNPAAIAAALGKIARAAPPAGASRDHFLGHLTLEKHLAGMAVALRSA